MDLKDKFNGIAGLCAKAGKMVYGAQGSQTAIKRGTARLIIIAGGASQNTVKEFSDSCKYYGIPCIKAEKVENMPDAVGKSGNKVFAVVDPGFAKKLRDIYKEFENRK